MAAEKILKTVVLRKRGAYDSTRRLRFYKDRVVLSTYCGACRSYNCWVDRDESRRKVEVRRILRNKKPTDTVKVGCQTFQGAVVKYARKWAAK